LWIRARMTGLGLYLLTIDYRTCSFMVPVVDTCLWPQAVGYLRLALPTPIHALPQIIDLMVLVVDAGKGIQTQTAECIVIGEVAAADMVVALNKTGEVCIFKFSGLQ